jgi:hypothetical protein
MVSGCIMALSSVCRDEDVESFGTGVEFVLGGLGVEARDCRKGLPECSAEFSSIGGGSAS